MADFVHVYMIVSLSVSATHCMSKPEVTSAAPRKTYILEYHTVNISYPDGVRCSTQDECPDRMCCVHNPLTKPDKIKRFLFGQYSHHDYGFCRRARKFNESCWPLGHDSANAELYEYFCPCESGLDCRGLVVHETASQIVHRFPTCQSPESNLLDGRPTPSGIACSSDGDCGAEMCCVRYPDSRKRDLHGYCRNERKINETCDRQDMATNDFKCPCQAGLECRGTVVQHFNHQTVHQNTICQKPVSK
ncbi:uncharacterized protein LOC123529724 [Mercenaria mercenaria]|uniref:uncharacterized protein LOC123529724 n=1 Tax=Mercenaria mercenaria TaxID=6596 RepID=UPI001E1E0F3D|nr:uncharacterized protein LOC123529724 [Mercenaria mercenaria]